MPAAGDPDEWLRIHFPRHHHLPPYRQQMQVQQKDQGSADDSIHGHGALGQLIADLFLLRVGGGPVHDRASGLRNPVTAAHFHHDHLQLLGVSYALHLLQDGPRPALCAQFDAQLQGSMGQAHL